MRRPPARSPRTTWAARSATSTCCRRARRSATSTRTSTTVEREFERAVDAGPRSHGPRRAHDRRPGLHGPRARRAARAARRRGDRRAAGAGDRDLRPALHVHPPALPDARRGLPRRRVRPRHRAWASRGRPSRRRSSRRPPTSRASRPTSRRSTAPPRARPTAPGRPIMAHSRPASRTGLDQMRIFLEEGVPAERVMIAHTGDTDDLDHIEELLALGPVHRDGPLRHRDLPAGRRSATRPLAALCERGYADRMVLSQDACATIDWFPEEMVAQLAPKWHVHAPLRGDPPPARRARRQRRGRGDDAGRDAAAAGCRRRLIGAPTRPAGGRTYCGTCSVCASTFHDDWIGSTTAGGSRKWNRSSYE